MVVRGGSTKRVIGVSSNPTTAASRGIASPRSRSAFMQPIAMKSLCAKKPVHRTPASSSCIAHA